MTIENIIRKINNAGCDAGIFGIAFKPFRIKATKRVDEERKNRNLNQICLGYDSANKPLVITLPNAQKKIDVGPNYDCKIGKTEKGGAKIWQKRPRQQTSHVGLVVSTEGNGNSSNHGRILVMKNDCNSRPNVLKVGYKEFITNDICINKHKYYFLEILERDYTLIRVIFSGDMGEFMFVSFKRKMYAITIREAEDFFRKFGCKCPFKVLENGTCFDEEEWEEI